MEEGKFLGYIVTSEGIRANPEKTKAVMDMPSPRTLKQMQSLSGKQASFNHVLSKSAERSLPFLDMLKKCTNKKDFRWTEAVEVAFLEMKKLVSELPTLNTLKKGKTLMIPLQGYLPKVTLWWPTELAQLVLMMMYLAATNEAVSAVLLTERDGRRIPIYYVSQSLQGGETNYALMEKLALALVHAVRWLAKWAVELGAYGIIYVPRVAVKGQVLADFLADTPTEINATPGRLYTDGESNNEGSRANLILIAPNDVEYSYVLRLNFSNFNNDVEYEALLAGLRIAMEMQVKDIHAFVDSKLVASQVEGSYEAKEQRTGRPTPLESWKRFNLIISKEVLVEVLNERPVEAQEGMDIVGPLSEGPGRVKYLIVITDYFTKWMEAKPLATITGKQVGNEAVERANRSLLRGIKTRLEKGGSAWVEEELRLNLDLLEERREIAAIREAKYKQQVEKYYNKKVRYVQFKVGEFVLRKNEASRANNIGKLGPTWEGPYKVIQAFQSGAYKLSNMETK
ncbi:reverse transcriptase domain-containing protein [Tanacetum coccineum]